MAYDRRTTTDQGVSGVDQGGSVPGLGEQFQQPMGNAAMQEQMESDTGEWEFGPIVGRGAVTQGGRSGGTSGTGGRRRVPSGTNTKRG